jgi:ribosomal-protein-alanine N-acetyltransferase
MNILLVNDDGFDAVGLAKLRPHLEKIGTVYMVAPKFHMSGKSCSINIFEDHGNPEVQKLDEYNYVLDGTPADCVTYALRFLHLPIDLVVSGCNEGLNYSYYSLYSGTLGACVQALQFNLKAIAFSCTIKHFDLIDKYTDEVLDYILKNNLLSNDYFLSVNYPNTDDVKGIKIGEMDFNNNVHYFNNEDHCSYINKDLDPEFKNHNGDLYQILHGYISIAPVSGTLFNEKYYHDLEAKVYGTKTLETKRLILRKLTMDDLDDCIKNWWNDEEVTRYMTWNPHNDRKVSQEFMKFNLVNYNRYDFFQWAIELKTNKEVIGTISAFNANGKECEIGYCIAKKYWHQGITSEAYARVLYYLFNELNYEVIYARHDIDNPHSGDVMLKCGMTYEKDVRSLAKREDIMDNKMTTLKCYKITKAEYESFIKAK